MAKAIKVKATATEREIELRRWCIEQAIRWPISGGYQSITVVGGLVPQQDADILGRAERIIKWVVAKRN